MSRRVKSIVAAFLCWILPPAVSAQSYQFTHYTQEDGLATGSISQILKDRSGYFWLLSEASLMRFDGYDFKVFKNDPNDSTSLPESLVDMRMDDLGNILIRGHGNICKYNPATGTFPRLVSASDGIPIYDWILGDSTVFWATSKDHLLRLTSDSAPIRRFPLTPGFNREAMTTWKCDRRSVWIVNAVGQVLRFDIASGRFDSIQMEQDSSFPGQKYTRPVCFFADPSGTPCLLSMRRLYRYNDARNVFVRDERYFRKNTSGFLRGNAWLSGKFLYAGNSDGELERIDVATSEVTRFPIPNGSTDPDGSIAVWGIFPAYDSTLWVSTLTTGAYHFNPETSAWQHFVFEEGNRNSLLSNSTDFIYAGERNVTWINCSGRGVVKVEKIQPSLAAYVPAARGRDPQNVLAENIRTLYEFDPGLLMVGSLGGMVTFNTHTKEFHDVPSPAGPDPVFKRIPIACIISGKNDDIWISQWRSASLYRMNYRRGQLEEVAVDSLISEFTTFRSLFHDSRGNLWVGTDAGVIYRVSLNAHKDGQRLRFEKFSALTHPELSNIRQCFAINEHKGSILFGMQNGFFVYDYSSNKFLGYSRQTGKSGTLSDDNVRSICVDSQDYVWLGTNRGGLNRFDPRTHEFVHFTERNGLPDNTIYTILENKSYLWLGTNKGLCRFYTKDFSCRNFSMKDGIQNYEYNTNAACKTSGGELAFGGRSGFNLFNPDSIFFQSEAPPVVITRFMVFDRELPLNSSIDLHYDENSLSFQFAALGYYRNSENQYAYKMDGIDKDWVYCGDRRFTNYANLPPGTYTFHVKASNCYGIWNEEGAMLSLTVGTPWWKSWTFRFLTIFAGTGLLYLIFLFRLKQKVKLQDVRNRIARDLHDEIGSNLSSISLFSEVAKEKARSQAQAVGPLLTKISEYTQVSQEAMNDIVWMINARNDRFENIIIHMRSLAAELLETKNIILHLDIDEKLNQMKMDMDRRKNFYLIYKESVNNIVKYAECRNVWIGLTLQRSIVTLDIRDDGKGFDTRENFRGNGLVNMKRRADALDGELQVGSEPGKGTTVSIKFKI